MALVLSPGCWLGALIFENFDAGDKKSEKQILSLGTWAVQRLMRKDDSPSQKWNGAQKVPLLFMCAEWLQVSKDHEGMRSHAFRNQAPKPFVVWLKMSELLGCCSGKSRIHFYVDRVFTLNLEFAHMGLFRDWQSCFLMGGNDVWIRAWVWSQSQLNHGWLHPPGLDSKQIWSDLAGCPHGGSTCPD